MMTWQNMGEGWTKRYNTLISAINRNVDVNEIKDAMEPPMDEEEIEWYIKSRKDLDEENERIRKMCEEKGIPAWRTGYDPVENEW